MKKRILITLAVMVILATGALTTGWFFVSHQLSRLEAYRDEITATLQAALHREVTYEKAHASLTLRAGLSLQFDSLVIREPDASADWVSVDKAFFRADLLPLLIGRVRLSEILLNHPRVALRRNEQGAFNIDDLLKPAPESGMTWFIRKLTVHNGELIFTDQAATANTHVTTLSDLSCRIEPRLWRRTSHIRLTATLEEGKNTAQCALSGTFRPAPSGEPITKGSLSATLKLTGTDLRHWFPYLKEITPFSNMAGRLDLETTVSGTLDHFDMTGTLEILQPRLTYPEVFVNPLTPQRLTMHYIVARQEQEVVADIIPLTLDGFSVTARLTLRDPDADDPFLEITGSSSTLSRKNVAAYVPWALIGPDVTGFVNEHVTGGFFRLIDLKLAGRLSQIAALNEPENAEVLSLRALVEKGVFAVTKTTPAFHNIQGTLALQNRQFSLQNITAFFGNSPCEFEGSISDYAGRQPLIYQASMRLFPGRQEVVWLIGDAYASELAFKGRSTLHLSGKGPVDKFRIGADWDLTGADYAFPGWLEKPHARPNRISADILVTPDALNITTFRYDLAPAALSGEAVFRFDGKKQATLRIFSDALTLADFAPMLPPVRDLHPAGVLSADVTGRGDLSDFGSFRWRGHVSLADVSFQPWNTAPLVRKLTGRAVFKDSRMATSSFEADFGKSRITGGCGVEDFRKPMLVCSFATPSFHSEDAGLTSTDDDVTLTGVKGRIALGEGRLRLDRLSLSAGKSLFRLKGELFLGDAPKVALSVFSPHIHVEDITRLARLSLPAHEDQPTPPVNLEATLRARRLSLPGADLTNLAASASLTDNLLHIDKLQADLFEGNLRAEGSILFSREGENQYKTTFSLNRVSLEKVETLLETGGRVITGSLSVSGNLTASGNDPEALKKTVAGTLSARAENGVLKKFAVLSKIFSVLNVAQLLRLKLPDMVKDGMPYDAITADLSLADGVFSSENFLIDSKAMQISAVGKVDAIKQEINSTVGVHPLQTLDRIAARIPVAGWLLTDENSRLVTVHFKVEGPLDNPKVDPIPVQSLTRGTLDIFRRLFELPEKLVTDTGDVLLGR
ncbi:MAG: AsmA-like C-terminal domain-containing protein [Smithellaceae bacterium]